MLVISRRQGEVLWIGDQIKIVVCTMRGKRVSLGIEAPRDIPVVRDELRKADLKKVMASANPQQNVLLEATDGICVK
jgi:carbon storage regulator